MCGYTTIISLQNGTWMTHKFVPIQVCLTYKTYEEVISFILIIMLVMGNKKFANFYLRAD